MKKFLCCFIFVTSSISLFSWDFGVSFSYQPFSFYKNIEGWKGVYGKNYTGFIEDEETYFYLDNNGFNNGTFYLPEYDMIYEKFGSYMVYQAGLKHRSGFNFGFGLGYDSGYKIDDNFVGLFADILGYIGFKFISLRVTNFALPGKVITYDIEKIANEEPATRRFINRRTTVELLYNFMDYWWEETTGFSLGIYFQNLTVAGAYTETILRSYGIICGWDTFNMFLIDGRYGDDKYYDGGFVIAPWFEMWPRFGLGFKGVEKNLNNEIVEDGLIAIDYYWESTFGLLFAAGKNSERFFLGGIGYNFEMNTGAIRHGVVVRGAVKF